MAHAAPREHSSQTRRQALRALALAGAGPALLGLGACASAPPPLPTGLLRDAAYRAPVEGPPPAAALTALSPGLRAFLVAQGWAQAPRHDARRALIAALYRPRSAGGPGLRLEYESARTRTAAEAFEAGAGNCLSLVLLTTALARQLELPVGFQAVQVRPTHSLAGSLTLTSGHVNVVLGARATPGTLYRSEPEPLVVDFLPARELGALQTLPLGEATVRAMFFNNRAVELLAADHVHEAYWHAREALAQDPAFLPAVNTLGVVHQRAGLPDAAEQAFRHVLAGDARSLPALRNLHGLLRQQGRTDEAAPLAERLAALQPEAPFQWLLAARDALALGDGAGAVALLQRELRLQPEHPEVHAALANAHLRLGQGALARRHLALALAYSTQHGERLRLEAKLGRLGGAGAQP
jgi:Tfp pilus assembly protein PilF